MTARVTDADDWLLLLSAGFAFLVHVLDAGLVNEQVRCSGAVHLQAVLVVPLDDAVDLLAIVQHQDHGRAGLHLLLVVEILGVRLLRWRGFLAAVRGTFGAVVTIVAAIALAVVAVVARMIVAVERGADQLAIGKYVGVKGATHGGGVHGIFHGGAPVVCTPAFRRANSSV